MVSETATSIASISLAQNTLLMLTQKGVFTRAECDEISQKSIAMNLSTGGSANEETAKLIGAINSSFERVLPPR